MRITITIHIHDDDEQSDGPDPDTCLREHCDNRREDGRDYCEHHPGEDYDDIPF